MLILKTAGTRKQILLNSILSQNLPYFTNWSPDLKVEVISNLLFVCTYFISGWLSESLVKGTFVKANPRFFLSDNDLIVEAKDESPSFYLKSLYRM